MSRIFARAHAVILIVLILAWSQLATAQMGDDGLCAPTDDACAEPAPEQTPPPATSAPPSATATSAGTLLFFWGVGCPHCEEAKPFIEQLKQEHPSLQVESIEVRRDPEGRARFIALVGELGVSAPGIPTFVHGQDYVVGFTPGTTERAIRRMVEGGSGEGSGLDDVESVGVIDLPWLGSVDSRAVPLPMFTLAVGLVDGINPCAMWVLLVLLGILTHVKERKRLLLFGGAFVLMSGVVYFLFMTVWVGLFHLVGLSRAITIGLGVVVLVMGIINLKELFWFKKGVSLMISDAAKPKLYKRMRGITRAASLPAALAGVVALAFVVNLIELGCTLGLPAVYTRILSLRADVSPGMRYAYLALYNLAYIVPLATIVGVYATTLHRMTLSERGAKVLKGVSGALLLLFGLLLIAAPEVLS